MTADDYKPEKVMNIESAEQTKAYFHPVRTKILRELIKRPLTVSQTAKQFSVHPANLTHHFRILEKAELIKLVEKRDIGRTYEKYFRAAALKYNVIGNKADIEGAAAKSLNVLKEDLAEAADCLSGRDTENMAALIWNRPLTEKQFREIKNDIFKMIQKYKNLPREDPHTTEQYSLSLCLYPSSGNTIPDGEIHLIKD